MVPLIELRGAIPYSQVVGLPLLPSYIVCIIGNMLPVPIIFFFARKVLEWGCDKPIIGKFFTFCLEKGHKGGEKLKEKAGKGLFWALLYNCIGIPVAAGLFFHSFGIILNPMIGAAAMSLSSVCVVLNALRLKTIKF